MMTLRLNFGGSPNPNNFGLVSESICDLANHLLSNSKWNHNKYFSPIQHNVPPIDSTTDDSPFSQALPMIVNVPNDPKGHAEI